MNQHELLKVRQSVSESMGTSIKTVDEQVKAFLLQSKQARIVIWMFKTIIKIKSVDQAALTLKEIELGTGVNRWTLYQIIDRLTQWKVVKSSGNRPKKIIFSFAKDCGKQGFNAQNPAWLKLVEGQEGANTN